MQTTSDEWKITGHRQAIDILQRTVAAQQIRHAYLFVGPQRIGKSLLARRFAQTLLCTRPLEREGAPIAPCHQCLSCRKVLHGNHPDVHYITRAADKQFIVIEQIREIQNAAARRSMEGRYRVFLIENAQDMNPQAANCLLKTLEEPESGVVLLLTVPEVGLLLPTVISRVQQIPMHLIPSTQIQEALQTNYELPGDEAALVAALAAGRMGWAVQAVEDDDMLQDRSTLLNTLIQLPTQNTVQRFDFIQKYGTDVAKLSELLELWLLWWRDILLASQGCLDLTVNVDRRQQLAQLVTERSARIAQKMITSIFQTREALAQNVNARVALEVLMLDLPRARG